MDSQTGLVTVKTSRAFEESLEITLIVGSQEIQSKAFTVKVYDCSKYMDLVPNVKV